MNSPQFYLQPVSNTCVDIIFPEPSPEGILYRIFRSVEGPNSGFKQIGESIDVTFSDGGLNLNSVYYYKAIEVDFNTNDQSAETVAQSVTTLNTTPSNPVTGLTAAPHVVAGDPSVAASVIDLAWDLNWDAMEYRIFRSKSFQPFNPEGYEYINGTSDPNYQDENLEEGAGYFYKVAAVIEGVLQDVCDPVYVVTNYLSTTPPPTGGIVDHFKAALGMSAPSFTANAYCRSAVTLTFPELQAGLAYNIYRSWTNGGSNAPYLTPDQVRGFMFVGQTSGTTFNDSGIYDSDNLDLHKKVYYKARIVAYGSEGPSSQIVEVVMPYVETPKINPVTGLAVVAVSTGNPMECDKVHLSWNAVSGASSYNVYKKNTSALNASQFCGIHLLTNVTGLTFDEAGLDPNTTYVYKVAAVINGQIQDVCAGVSVVTLNPNLPLNTISFSFDAGKQVYKASTTIPNGFGDAKLHLFRRTNCKSGWEKVATSFITEDKTTFGSVWADVEDLFWSRGPLQYGYENAYRVQIEYNHSTYQYNRGYSPWVGGNFSVFSNGEGWNENNYDITPDW